MAFALAFHSFWRWVLLITTIVVVVKAVAGWLGKQPFTRLDERLGLLFTGAVDIQLFTGLIIWLFGPMGLRTLDQAMSNAGLRFIVLEHPILALISAALAHIGLRRARHTADGPAQHRTALIFYVLSLLFLALIFIMR